MGRTHAVTEMMAPTGIEAENGAHDGIEFRSGTLMLADGSRFHGLGLGDVGIVGGELVFTTAMTGYQEALTDPSYRGQILLFTYPLIGNYGVDPGRAQSEHAHPRAVIVSTLSPTWGGPDSLTDYFRAHCVPTLFGVDTRAIAQRLRSAGAMPAALQISDAGSKVHEHALREHLASCDYGTRDLVSETTVREPELHGAGRKRIALLDCGNKRSVIAELVGRGAQVVVLPARTSTDEIMALAPDGVLISNGPGNPTSAEYVLETIRALFDRLPILGICLGHQLLALAADARTYKLKFGHRGANHPVEDCATGRAFISTQNHGYAVDEASLPSELQVSHRNLNDGTVEGLRHRTLPIRSVQFHPEGAPGPRDTSLILDEWLKLVA